MTTSTQRLLQFIDKSPTAFHAVANLASDLEGKGYKRLFEGEHWMLTTSGKYFVTRADASIIIFHTPQAVNSEAAFRIIGAHTDSPCLKVKSNPISQREGYQLLNIEVYGGVLVTSWFDKDLYIGGRVFTEDGKGQLVNHLVQLPFKVRIPRVAIHLNRDVVKNGFQVNPQVHMFPVMGLEPGMDFDTIIKRALGTGDAILSWDLFLFDAEPCSFGGIQEEFVFAPRLDNLGSVHASFEALTATDHAASDFQMAAYFHNEEIGSNTQSGADSNFIEVVMQRIFNAFGHDTSAFFQSVANSFFISADMAHAVHPNYSELHDPHHKPMINKGPVIKSNANMRYATDGWSIAKFKQWCHAVGAPYQDFHTRNDMGCGSTIGPMTAAKLGIPTIDMGNPMLSMHSIREMAGSADHDVIIRVFGEFYRG